MTSIDRLDYFICAARLSNFSRAAKECCVAQSTISHSIASLERELHCILFSRTAGGVRLTPQGQAFFKNALRLQKRYTQAVTRARAMAKAPQQMLFTVGLSAPEDGIILQAVFKDIKTHCPELTFLYSYYNPADTQSDLALMQYDLILAPLPPKQHRQAKYIYLPFAQKVLTTLLPVSHPLSKAPHLTLDDLLQASERIFYTQSAKTALKNSLLPAAAISILDAGMAELTCVTNDCPVLDMRYESGTCFSTISPRIVEKPHIQQLQCVQYSESSRHPALELFPSFWDHNFPMHTPAVE